jgi:hypothetical protein
MVTNLVGETWDLGEVASLVGGISRVLARPAPVPTVIVSLEARLKVALRDPAGDIALTILSWLSPRLPLRRYETRNISL